MSISFLHPVFDALREIGCPASEMAARLFVEEPEIDASTAAIPANLVYAFLGWAAERASDPQFAARCGMRMAKGHWQPVVPLFAASSGVGDFLVRFTAMAAKQGRAAAYRLEVEGDLAIWRLTRPAGTVRDRVHADAMAVGFFGEILRLAAGSGWDAGTVTAVTSDATLIPRDLLPAAGVIAGADGVSLRFPSALLALPLADLDIPIASDAAAVAGRPPTYTAESVRALLATRLDDPEFGIDRAAASLGLSRWRLQELLQQDGTSFSVLKRDLRRDRALDEIGAGDASIKEVAAALGYTNRTNFTRAFRQWTGLSPRAYRARHRAGPA